MDSPSNRSYNEVTFWQTHVHLFTFSKSPVAMKKHLEMEEQRSVKLHNVNFYNLAPRAIQCLAFNRSTLKVALSR